jgi:hypothetical protein
MAVKGTRANGATLPTDGPAIDRAIEKYKIKHPGHGYEQICAATESLDPKICGPVSPVSPRTLLKARNGGPITSTGLNAIAWVLDVPFETLVAKASQDAGHVELLVDRAFQRATKDFLDEYIVSEKGLVPFGGRDTELKRLNDWLLNREAAPRLVVTSPAGRGKSALLVKWMQLLREQGYVEQNKWQLVFIPISIRVGTNKPASYLRGLAQGLAQITGQPIAAEAIRDTEILKFIIQEQLEAIVSKGSQVLLVIDGLDEALQGTFDATMIPTQLRSNARVVLSARWQVGDVDSAGWLRRLGWDRSFRVEQLELEQLTPDEIADVLLKLGAPIDLLAREQATVARLAELTEGEPILVRYYVEDLWQLVQQGARVERSDLDSLPQGFGNYFTDWLEHQERLWLDEGMKVETDDVDRVLSVLAFALGPLESRDLLEIMSQIHGVNNLLSERELLRPLRRFVIGDGKPNSGYVLSHPKIADYLKNERFSASAGTLLRGFTTWCQSHIRSLNSGVRPSNAASRYVLQFARGHFGDLSPKEWMELVENGWRNAWEHFEGTPRGFASDVRAAWDVVQKSAVGGLWLGAIWRCAIVISSVKSLHTRTSFSLIFEAVARDRLSTPRAIHYLTALDRGEVDIAWFLLDQCERNNVSKARAAEFISAAFEMALSCKDESDLGTILELLAPHLSSVQLKQAFEVATAVRDPLTRASALGELAKYASQEERAETYAQALAAAKLIEENEARARALTELIPSLSKKSKAEAVSEAFAAAKAVSDADDRGQSLLRLTPYLSPKHKAAALAQAFIDVENTILTLSRSQFESPLAFSRFLLPAQRVTSFERALASIGDIKDSASRATALGNLVQLSLFVPELSAEQKSQLVADALAVTKRIDDDAKRAYALRPLVKNLSSEQLIEAISIAMETPNAEVRSSALTSLVPHLHPNQRAGVLSEAFAAAKTIAAESARARAFTSLAPNLSSQQLAEALTEIRAFRDENDRIDALATLVGYLPQQEKAVLVSEAFAAAKAIWNENQRTRALRELASHLSSAQISDALIAIKEIHQADNRVTILDTLAPYLSNEQITEALEIAKQIGDQPSRVRAFSLLAKYLRPEHKATAVCEAFDIAKDLSDEMDFANALDSLAPDLSQEQVADALAKVSTFSDEKSRAEALTSLATQLTPEQQVAAQGLAKAFISDRYRGRLLGLLAANLPTRQLADAIVGIRAIDSPEGRFEGLVRIIPNLNPNTKGGVVEEALTAARAINNDSSRAAAFEQLAEYLSADQLGEVVREIDRFEGGLGAWVLGVLSQHLSSEQRGQALAVAASIRDEDSRANALWRLARHLSQRQLAEATSIARGILDAQKRLVALLDLAQYLETNERTKTIVEAFDIAKLISDESTRGWAFGLLAPVLSREHLAEALAEVGKFRDKNNYVEGVTKVGQHLPPQEKATLISKALVACQSIQDERLRSHALQLLAPHLSPEQAADVYLAAGQFRNYFDRQPILESVACRLPPKEIPDAIKQAKELGELCHARVLASVAQHLSPEELAEGFVVAREQQAELHALDLQVQQLTTAQQAFFVTSLAKLAAEVPRDHLIDVIRSSLHTLVAVGGSELLEDLCRAVADTGRWYP